MITELFFILENGVIRVRAVGLNCDISRPYTHIKIKFADEADHEEDDASPIVDVPQNDYDSDYGKSLVN